MHMALLLATLYSLIVLYHFHVDSAMPWHVCKREGDEAIALPASRFNF